MSEPSMSLLYLDSLLMARCNVSWFAGFVVCPHENADSVCGRYRKQGQFLFCFLVYVILFAPHAACGVGHCMDLLHATVHNK
jgi:hypothetical protein